MTEPLHVSFAEAEQKLMAFLARRIDAPTSMFHKWIRSGQVRVNGLRVKAFHRIAVGDIVRIPPFAVLRELHEASPFPASETCLVHDTFPADSRPSLQGKDLSLACIYEDEHIMLVNKPAGLPVHPGTGHTDSISTRLALRYGQCAFVPSPAHRLDKDTSGILAIGKSYTGLRNLQDLFARRPANPCAEEAKSCNPSTLSASSPPFEKTYLAWLCGHCPWDEPIVLTHTLAKGMQSNAERIIQHPQGQEAQSIVTCIRRIVTKKQAYSLVRVQLLTGRKHQIRAQMSIMGFPLVGDVRYGGKAFSMLLLHAYRLVLPQGTFEIAPLWPSPFVTE